MLKFRYTAATSASPIALVPMTHPRPAGRCRRFARHCQHFPDAGFNALCEIFPAERIAHHHRQRKYRGDRVGLVLAGDVRRRAVDRFVQAPLLLASSEAEGSMPMEPASIEASIGEDVAEDVAVTITSNCFGARTSCIAALSTYMCES